MNNIYKKILRQIKKYDNIIIVRHIGADPDALGSQFALKEIIKNLYPKKNVYAIGSPSNRFRFMGILDKMPEINLSECLLIVLDIPDLKRIDGANPSDYGYVIKIDHHPFIDEFGDLVLVDDTASSACQLILEFVFANKIKLDTSVAEKLFWGIVSDTGRFMHAYTTTRTLELVTRMIEEVNLDFTSLYEPLYMRPLSEVRFQGYIYDNMTVTENGVAYIKIEDDLLKEYGVDSASAGNIISELKCINELWIWVFLTEDKKSNLIRANIRSRGPAINEVASIFGGGGHQLASGARLTSWKQADDLIKSLDELAGKYVKETSE